MPAGASARALFDAPQPGRHASTAARRWASRRCCCRSRRCCAIRDAVSAVGGHRVDPPLRAPATPEAVLDAVEAVRAAAR
ncbi:MAG: hypothetical protein MZW92_56510 [Comamonadaceae bacterium]|nr:hypothetical protein [Comamonadaceae bacterium]